MERGAHNSNLVRNTMIGIDLGLASIILGALAVLGTERVGSFINSSAVLGVFGITGIVGIGMIIVSLPFRTSSAPPIASLNRRHWIPLWRQQDFFRPPGFWLMIVGFQLLGIACLALVFAGLVSL